MGLSLSLSPFLEVISQTAVDQFFSSSLLPGSAADKEVVSAADVALPVVAVVVVAPRSPLALLSVSLVVVVIPDYSPAKLVRSAASADAAMQPRAVPDSTCMSVRLSLSLRHYFMFMSLLTLSLTGVRNLHDVFRELCVYKVIPSHLRNMGPKFTQHGPELTH